MAVTTPAPHNSLQAFYETPGVPLSSGPDRARRQARMLSRILRDTPGPAVILDLGCGDGSALQAAAQQNPAHHFAGLDWSADALHQATTKGLTTIRGTIETRLPIADGKADVVIMSELIEHLVDPDTALAEVKRVLRPGGHLLLSTPNLAAWYNRGLLAVGIQPVFSEVSLTGVFGRPGRVVAGHLRLFTRRALTGFLTASGFRCVTVKGARYHDVPRLLRPLDRAFCRWPSAASILLVHAEKEAEKEAENGAENGAEKEAAQVHDPETEAEQPPAPGPRRRRRRRGLELTGLAIGILAGVGIALAWLIPARSHHERPAAPSTHAPVLVPGDAAQPQVPSEAGQPDPAALDQEWTAYSDQSTCADWAGGDGASAIRLNDTQLAWFFSDTFIGPAGPTTGFSNLSGFVHNAVVVQTMTARGSTFVTMTGGGACTGPGGPGNAAPVVGAPPSVPGGASDRYWDEDGIEVNGTVVKFYNKYLALRFPFIPAGTVIATFPASQLSSAGHGHQYGAVARPGLVTLPSYTPPSGGSPILWGAAVLRVGTTVYIYGTQSPNVQVPGRQLYLARVPVSQLTSFSAWRFYAGPGAGPGTGAGVGVGPGLWMAGQRNAEPVQPPGRDLAVSSGFSVIQAGSRYWLIQGGVTPGGPDIDAYPASTPWGPFDPAHGRLLYRDPNIGLSAADDYRIMYEARAEPALSTPETLVISYNVNSEAVTTGCQPMADFTNTVTLPRFVAVPVTAFGDHPGAPAAAARSGPSDDPRIVPQNPSQWFDAWDYPRGGCPPVPGLTEVQATPATGKVTLSWPDAGLGLRYRVYLLGPGESGGTPVTTANADSATITGLQPGSYQAKVVPVNVKTRTGPAAKVTFKIP
ncbi:MAG TPA: methyltransferase domain-containing protein [Streptosporangiaceae bacterium]|nr:methyltransferase domain-containing protein [Streptosporangiaceae bacterium]